MSISTGFIVGRAQATKAVQERLAGAWVWEDKTVAGWQNDLTAPQAKEAQLEGADMDLNRARASADAALDELHGLTAQGLGMARAKYRNDPETLGLLKGLDAEGDGRRDVLDDALAWEVAWQRLPDADWSPTPTNTRAAFTALRQAAAAKAESLEAHQADARKARREQSELAGHLWEDCVVWYRSACLVFPEPTPEGQMIRGLPTEPRSGAAAGPKGPEDPQARRPFSAPRSPGPCARSTAWRRRPQGARLRGLVGSCDSMIMERR